MNTEIYNPVRKVSNKNSRNVPHNSGIFYSFKMKKDIHYESLSECYFYYFLDLNPKVKTFYPQPLKIRIPFLNDKGDLDFWEHVPDVLVFWDSSNSPPTLYQVKYEALLNDKKQQLSDKECEKYCRKQNWRYEVVEIIKVNKTVIKNLKFLHGYIKERKFYTEISPVIEEIICLHREMTIDNLCLKLHKNYSELFVLPTIYYLITKGKLSMNLYEPIGRETRIFNGTLISQLETNFKGVSGNEDYIFENKC